MAPLRRDEPDDDERGRALPAAALAPGVPAAADRAQALPEVLDRARAEGWGLLATLERLLAAEVEATEARRLASRLRFACPPAPWRIADFDFSAQPGVQESLIRELATLRFLDTAANLLFL